MSKKMVIVESTLASLSLVAIFVFLPGLISRWEHGGPFARPSPTESLTRARKCIESARNAPAELARLAVRFEGEAKRLWDEAWEEKKEQTAERLRMASVNFRKLAKLLLDGKVDEVLSGSETGVLLSAFEYRALAHSPAESSEGEKPVEDERADKIGLKQILGLCAAIIVFAGAVIGLVGQLFKMKRQRGQATDKSADK